MSSVYIIDGARSPFLKAKSKQGPFSASDLAVKPGRQLLARQTFDKSLIDEVIFGNTMPGVDEANIARIIALRLGLGNDMPAFSVHRNCASGMQALDSAFLRIKQGQSDIILAGGGDAMSRAPILFNNAMVNWLGGFMTAKTVGQKLKAISRFRPKLLTPVIALLKGLTDPIVGLNMGQTAEELAFKFNITRKDMDGFAMHSHQRLLTAREQGLLHEITPILDSRGNVYADDDGVRTDSTLEKLGKLRPFFDKKFGMVTAANSSQVTDGAALLLLASEKAVQEHGLQPLAKIIDTQWAALNPEIMGLGPVHASTPILQRNNLQLGDIDFWEINEAFAAQVIACQRAWQDEDYCKTHLNLEGALGELKSEQLNVDGGAICVGHPIGASGARIVLHLVNVLTRNKAKKGMASICIGGGQGGAMLIERVGA